MLGGSREINGASLVKLECCSEEWNHKQDRPSTNLVLFHCGSWDFPVRGVSIFHTFCIFSILAGLIRIDFQVFWDGRFNHHCPRLPRSAQTAASAAACLHGAESDTNQVAALAEAAQQAVGMPRKMGGMSVVAVVIAQVFPRYEGGPLSFRNRHAAACSSKYG